MQEVKINRISLTFFGWPQLEEAGKPLPVKSRKGLALLAYLAVTGGPQSRDVLASLLWPDFDETRARANLRRTLHILNRTPINRWLIADQDKIELRPDNEENIDLSAFTNFLREGSITSLSKAVGLYTADFLHGFHLPDSDPFDEWATLQREQVQRQMLETLDRLADHHLNQANPLKAESFARRLLEIDSYRESAWRQLMTALVDSERPHEALVEFEKCQELLMEELNVHPAAETIELARSIREKKGVTKETIELDRDARIANTIPTPKKEMFKIEKNPPPSPYRGLRAFREQDALFFFGREPYIELLATSVYDQSIVPLVGPSGSGKSSVIHAGLIPELRKTTNWLIISFRPGQRPFNSLADRLISYMENDLSESDHLIESGKLAIALQEGTVSLYDCVVRLQKKHLNSDRVVIIADQFEELYSLVPDAQVRHNFLDMLLDLVFMQQYRHDPIFSLVLTFRADFLGMVLEYRPLADAIQDIDVKLGPMALPEMRRAIEKPALAHGVGFEPGLVSRILEEIGQKPGRLPLLQFTLDQLWGSQENEQISHASYSQIGGVEGALSGYAEEIFTSLGSVDQGRARRIFMRLVQPGEMTEDVRRIVPRNELEDDWQLVSYLADARLLVTSHDSSGIETVELVHEALIVHWHRLSEWLAADREFHLWQERFRATLRNWHANAKDEGSLLRGNALTIAQDHLKNRANDFTQEESAFIRRSSAQATRRRKRLLITAVVSVSVLLALLLVAVGQWRNSVQAQNDAIIKLGEQLALQALNQPSGAYDRALLLAAEALNTANSDITRAAITELLLSNPHVRRSTRTSMPQPRFAGGAISPGGRYGAFPADGTISIWDVSSGERLTTTLEPAQGAATAMADFTPDGQWLVIGQPVATVINPWTGEKKGEPIRFPLPEIEAFALSPDANRLAAIDEGLLVIWDMMATEFLTIPTSSSPMEESAFFLGVDFNVNGDSVAAGCETAALCLWDARTGNLKTTLSGALTGSLTKITFSPDGRYVASGSDDGAIMIWDTITGLPLTHSPISHPVPVTGLAFDPRSSRLVSGGDDGSVILWDLNPIIGGGDISKKVLGRATNTISWLAFSSNGEDIISVTAENNAESFPPTTEYIMTVWNPDVRSGLPPAVMLQNQDGGVVDLTFQEDGNLLTADSNLLFRADGSLDFTDPVVHLRNWTIPEGNLASIRAALPVGMNNTGATLSDDGRWLAVGPRHGPVLLSDLGSATPVTRTLDGPLNPVIGLDFSGDGRYLAGGTCHEGNFPMSCDQGEVWVWDLQTGDRVGPLVGNDDVIHGLSLSENGRWLVTPGSQLLLWDLSLDNPEPSLLANAPGTGTDSYLFVEMSRDGQWIVASQTEGPHLWQLTAEGNWSKKELEPGPTNLLRVAFDPASELLVAGDFDGGLTVWDLESGAIVRQPAQQQFNQVYALSFNLDGTLLASGSLDGRLIVWDVSQLIEGFEVSPEEFIQRVCEIANRNLSLAEWENYFGDEPYRQTCPNP